MTKAQMRQQLQSGMTVFLSEGKAVTKCEPKNRPEKRQPKQGKMIEIDVDYLPKDIRLKHFGPF